MSCWKPKNSRTQSWESSSVASPMGAYEYVFVCGDDAAYRIRQHKWHRFLSGRGGLRDHMHAGDSLSEREAGLEW